LDGRPGGIASTATNYLTINDVFVGSNTNSNIELLNAANNNTIQFINCNAANVLANGAGSRVIAVGSTSSTGNTNNTISNCVVTGGLRGIQDIGPSDAVPNIGTIIQNNTIQNFSAIGIMAGSGQKNCTIQSNFISMAGYNVLVAPTSTGAAVGLVAIQQQSTLSSNVFNILNNTISLVTTSLTVTNLMGITDVGTGTENIIGNTITNLSAPLSTTATTGNSVIGITANNGIVGQGASTINISKNKIAGLTSTGTCIFKGIELFPANGSTLNINNNFVSITEPNTAATTVVGIQFGNTTGFSYTSNVYFNSVRIGGTQTVGGVNYIASVGIARSDNNTGSVFNMKNNICINDRSYTGSGSVFGLAFSNTNPTVGSISIDYNTYSVTQSPMMGARWGGFVYPVTPATPASSYFVAAAPNETNSSFATIDVVSNTDLHLTGASQTATALRGITIAGLALDIDGHNRPSTPARGADEPAITAPIQLLSFIGKVQGNNNQLEWNTTSETNNSGFELLRSVDGKNFTVFARIASKAIDGTSFNVLKYDFLDAKPFIGNSYYQLKQVDKDGKFSLSNIVLLKSRNTIGLAIGKVYPNPASEKINMAVTSLENTDLNINLLDVFGNILSTQSYAAIAGDNTVSFNVEKLPAGAYYVKVVQVSTGLIATTTFVK